LAGVDRERGDMLNGISLFVLIEGRTLVGDLEGARRAWHLGEVLQHVTVRALVDAATARMLAASGQAAEALDVLSSATERAGGAVNILADVLAHVVDVCAELGATSQARAANARLQALPHDGTGVAHTMRLLLANALGERDLDSARAARAHALGFGLALDGARALALCGTLADDPDALIVAFHEVEQLGAGHYRTEFAAELRRLGRRAPSRHRKATELSAIEVDLVAFLAQGMTNRQIARRMYLSPKTVEVYLSRIYTKTGRRSRVELAVAFQDGTVGTNA
jgi:DNA-binding CsgD family transcriptional regulator